MSTMKIIRRNKYTIICITICTLICLGGYGVYTWLFPNKGAPVYGDRLNGIDKVTLTDSYLKEITEKIKEDEKITSVKFDIKGKIINVIIKVTDEVDLVKAKIIPTTILSLFKEEEVAFYDFEVFIESDNAEKVGFPIIGYKGSSSEAFSFNKEIKE